MYVWLYLPDVFGRNALYGIKVLILLRDVGSERNQVAAADRLSVRGAERSRRGRHEGVAERVALLRHGLAGLDVLYAVSIILVCSVGSIR